jgi:hypothetical protein
MTKKEQKDIYKLASSLIDVMGANYHDYRIKAAFPYLSTKRSKEIEKIYNLALYYLTLYRP